MNAAAANRRVDAYVESGVGMAWDDTFVAWTFDLDTWGRCGQGLDEASALADLRDELRRAGVDATDIRVVERVHGDELAFERDAWPASDDERAATLAILESARTTTLALLDACPDELLDVDNPERVLPAFARWRTLRAMFWHVADADCRYYLGGLGLETRPRAADLATEMIECTAHVRRVVGAMPLDRAARDDQGHWTSTKVLRRLAWHERSELRAMRDLAVANAALLGWHFRLPSD
jgi:hypothetical protein